MDLAAAGLALARGFRHVLVPQGARCQHLLDLARFVASARLVRPAVAALDAVASAVPVRAADHVRVVGPSRAALRKRVPRRQLDGPSAAV